MNSMNSAFSAMDGFKKGFDVVSNNISNVNSIGFKSSKMSYVPAFSTVLQRSVPSSLNSNSNQVAMQVGNGLDIGGTVTNFSQGALERTEQDTDLAIVGDGYFKVTDHVSNTSYLTRVGNFRQDDNEYLVTYMQGYRLQGLRYDGTSMPAYKVDYQDGTLIFTAIEPNQSKNAPTVGDLQIKFSYQNSDVEDEGNNVFGGKLYMTQAAKAEVNANRMTKDDIVKKAPSIQSLSIGNAGEIYYTFSDNNSTKALGGKILLTKVNDKHALMHEGDGLFTGLDAAGTLPFEQNISEAGLNGIGYIRSKALEMSNVDLSKEFSETITLQRGFQAVARVITVADEILTEVVNLKR